MFRSSRKPVTVQQGGKTISSTWARKEETSSLALSLPRSFSLPLKLMKGFYFHYTRAILSLEKTQRAQQATVPFLLLLQPHWPPRCFLHTPGPEPSSPQYPHCLLSFQSLLSCHLLHEAFPSPYLTLQAPPPSLALPPAAWLYVVLPSTCQSPTCSAGYLFRCLLSVSTHQGVLQFFYSLLFLQCIE